MRPRAVSRSGGSARAGRAAAGTGRAAAGTGRAAAGTGRAAASAGRAAADFGPAADAAVDRTCPGANDGTCPGVADAGPADGTSLRRGFSGASGVVAGRGPICRGAATVRDKAATMVTLLVKTAFGNRRVR